MRIRVLSLGQGRAGPDRPRRPFVAATSPRRKGMLRAGGRHRSALLVVALALLTLFSTVGFAGVTQGTGPLNTPAPALTIYGSWAISTALSYANTSILVEGSVTILSGGSLTLQIVQLSLIEPLALQFGIEVRAG